MLKAFEKLSISDAPEIDVPKVWTQELSSAEYKRLSEETSIEFSRFIDWYLKFKYQLELQADVTAELSSFASQSFFQYSPNDIHPTDMLIALHYFIRLDVVQRHQIMALSPEKQQGKYYEMALISVVLAHKMLIDVVDPYLVDFVEYMDEPFFQTQYTLLNDQEKLKTQACVFRSVIKEIIYQSFTCVQEQRIESLRSVKIIFDEIMPAAKKSLHQDLSHEQPFMQPIQKLQINREVTLALNETIDKAKAILKRAFPEARSLINFQCPTAEELINFMTQTRAPLRQPNPLNTFLSALKDLDKDYHESRLRYNFDMIVCQISLWSHFDKKQRVSDIINLVDTFNDLECDYILKSMRRSSPSGYQHLSIEERRQLKKTLSTKEYDVALFLCRCALTNSPSQISRPTGSRFRAKLDKVKSLMQSIGVSGDIIIFGRLLYLERQALMDLDFNLSVGQDLLELSKIHSSLTQLANKKSLLHDLPELERKTLSTTQNTAQEPQDEDPEGLSTERKALLINYQRESQETLSSLASLANLPSPRHEVSATTLGQ